MEYSTGTNQRFANLRRHTLRAGLLTATAIMLSGCGKDETWWAEEWTLRKQITVDPSAGGVAGDPGESRVLLRLSDTNYTFSSAKEDGTDLRFIADDNKTELPFYIEKFDPNFNEAHVWVKPQAPGKTSFTLYYGNTGPKAVKADDSKETFDAATVLSWSFSDKGTGPGDGTPNGNNGDSVVSQNEVGNSGSSAVLAPGTTIAIADSPSLTWVAGGAMTWSAWIKPGKAPASGGIFTRDGGANGFTIAADNGNLVVSVKSNNDTVKSELVPLSPDIWQHVAVTAGAGQVNIYINGDAAKAFGASLPALNNAIAIGAIPNGTPGFPCEIDEMQLANIARSPAWVKFAALSQGSTDAASKIVQVGADEQGEAGMFAAGGTASILLGSLTIDGWIVVVILAIMAVISWWIMYAKMRYIKAISKGNKVFMNAWKHVAQDLTVLDGSEAEQVKTLGGKISPEGQRTMRQSTVYRLYHIGSEEIRHRRQADGEKFTQNGLSARTMHAIKASMDGGFVREGQKLSSLIVLLTICISGGPFLGLLGTVVGVMITFADIAAAGDVNVNAIAPGIAAALVATVAGLAVAIPALFGYNYIQSKVKEANADMLVFIDEFVTKMAEFYPEKKA